MKTILVVDDDDSFRDMLRTVLETRGFNVLTAANTGEGLELAAAHALDAALTDYQMPRIDGLAFCRALRVQNQALDCRLPVWLMTGCPALKTEDALAAGAEGVFRKPFLPVEIARQLERRIVSIMRESEVRQ